uniref:Protein TIC 214 n=1 Tax=Plumbago auriculata TaxID=45172 RepID=D3WF25_PLUAU|nr:hypothetical chloroplast RF1 [Plumbago auriculata]YP_009568342.1 hypothetical chloroplast RF1 [Plumbago auriculata]ADD30921.1 putative RF1 protein [Plumbago auriculata]QBE86612.1 hypothetical chloroplast RF1 [Plumbago auriculata]QBE86624.1 hypothetical chloroplast RF1 [Plumbago auriculata]
MIFLLLGNLCTKIINSVVVVGLYYGFLTTLSIGPSYLALLRTLVMEKGKKGTEKKVAATTGFIMGQLIMFISIYYRPLHLALNRPHTITFVTLPYLFIHCVWKNHHFDHSESATKDFLPSLIIQRAFLHNLFCQVFNLFILPNSMLARLVNIYLFRCKNKMLFLTSSFVAWLIGQILLMKCLGLVLVWIRSWIWQKHPIQSIIRSNKYLNLLLSRFRSNKYLNLLLSRFRSNTTKYLNVLLSRFRSNKYIKVLSRSKSTKYLVSELKSLVLDLKYRVSEFRYQVSEFRYFVLEELIAKDRIYPILLFSICAYYLGRTPPTTFSKSLKKVSETFQFDRVETVFETGGWEEGKRYKIEEGPVNGKYTIKNKYNKKIERLPLFSPLFNYRRWRGTVRYITNYQLRNPVRNEMSQFSFSSYQSDGQVRISFTHSSSLLDFFLDIEPKLVFSFFATPSLVYFDLHSLFKDALFNYYYWIYNNERKWSSLRKEFTDRIEALDIGSPYLDVLEKKIRLCNNKTKKEYLPKIYDPFLNGSYRGIIKRGIINKFSILNETPVEDSMENSISIEAHNEPYKKWVGPYQKKIETYFENRNKFQFLFVFNGGMFVKGKLYYVLFFEPLYEIWQAKVDKMEKKCGFRIKRKDEDKESLRRYVSHLIESNESKEVAKLKKQINRINRGEVFDFSKVVWYLCIRAFVVDPVVKTIYDATIIAPGEEKIIKRWLKRRNLEKRVPQWPYNFGSEADIVSGRKTNIGAEKIENFQIRSRYPRRLVLFARRERFYFIHLKDNKVPTHRYSLKIPGDDYYEKKPKNEKWIIKYPQEWDFRRGIIWSTMRVKRRKMFVFHKVWQMGAHCPLFYDQVKDILQVREPIVNSVRKLRKSIQSIPKRIKKFFRNKKRFFRNKKTITQGEGDDFLIEIEKGLIKLEEYQEKEEIPQSMEEEEDEEDDEEEKEEKRMLRMRKAEQERLERYMKREEYKGDKLEADEEELESTEPSEFEDYIACVDGGRTKLLLTYAKIRKWIILPSLIIAKNLVRLLLLQEPEWDEDIRDWRREKYIPSSLDGSLIEERAIFNETWEGEGGVEIKILYPFRLKPWHRSKIQPSRRDPMKKKKEKKNLVERKNLPFSFISIWGGMEVDRLGNSFDSYADCFSCLFVPIFKKSKKAIRKWSFRVLKFFKKRTKFLKVPKELKNLREDSSEIKIDSIIKKIKKGFRSKNEILHELPIQIRPMDRTKDELTEIKMKDLTDRTSTIRNEIKRITKDKKNGFRTRKKKMSPNKTSYGAQKLASLKNIFQIFKRRKDRLICKSHYFLKLIVEGLYTDILLEIFPYIINRLTNSLSRPMIIIKLFLKLRKKKKNEKIIKRISTIKKKLEPCYFRYRLSLHNEVSSKPEVFLNLSLVSQAYVFYKLSQTPVINLYKLRSVLQYDGASLFLNNEIKDYFRRQGIISSELKHKKLPNSGMNQWKNWLKLKHKKLPNSGMNQWKNWLKSHYQYELSALKWSQFEPQEWRNRVNQHCRVENRNLIKRDSSEREERVSLLVNINDRFQKTYRYDLLSYQSIYYEDKKDSYSYGSAFQVNKNQEISYTYNYNIHKPKLLDMGGIPIIHFIRSYYLMGIGFPYRFDTKGLFSLQIHNKNKEINPSNQKGFFFVFDWIFDWMGMNLDWMGMNLDWMKMNLDWMKMNEDSMEMNEDSMEMNEDSMEMNKDWMKMNEDWMKMEERLNRPGSNPIPWLFPQFGLFYNAYKMKTGFIPIHSLFDENGSEIPSKTIDQKYVTSDAQKPRDNLGRQKTRLTTKGAMNMNDFRKIFFGCQISWGTPALGLPIFDFFLPTLDNIFVSDLKKKEKEIDFEKKLKKLKRTKKKKDRLRTLWLLKRDTLNPYIVKIWAKRFISHSFSKMLRRGLLTMEPVRMPVKENLELIMYQTIRISLVHEIQQKNKKKRERNHYDLLVPENILSSRRRRELRILSCLNSRNSKGVDKNAVFCNGNKVKTCGQFLDERKDLDRDKKKLMKFKFFLWPNYRLEDLACMNRYWFDTNNGSRFSMLRIHMYPRLKNSFTIRFKNAFTIYIGWINSCAHALSYIRF